MSVSTSKPSTYKSKATPINALDPSTASSNYSLRHLWIICLSNMVAYFDFLIYLYLASILNSVFFPASANAMVSQLQMMVFFAAGYLSRPLGALLIGRYGDIYGRKKAFIISLSSITFTTLAIAVLPTHAQIGIFAPIIFVIARIIQGMAFGAHSPLGWVFVTEHLPNKQLASQSSLVTASFFIGVLGTIVFFSVLNSSFTQNELLDYGWRIPFGIGALLSMMCLLLSKQLTETPAYLSQAPKSSYWSGIEHIKPSLKHFNALFLSCLITFVVASIVVVVALILPELILLKFSIDEALLAFANGIGLLFLALGCVFYGVLADKTSLGRTLLLGSVVFMLQTLGFYYHLENGTGGYILVMYALLGFCSGIISLGPVIMVQLFVTKVRLTAVSLTYNSIYAVVGGALPFALMYATEVISFSPALYLTFVGIVAFILGIYVSRLPGFAKSANDSLLK